MTHICWIDVFHLRHHLLLDLKRVTTTVRISLLVQYQLKSLLFDRCLDRPYTSNSRYRDESDDHHSQAHTPASKASFQAHVNALDRRYDQTYQTHQRGYRSY